MRPSTDSVHLPAGSRALDRVDYLLPILEHAIRLAEEEFRADQLDMERYEAVSDRLKRLADEFHSNYP